MNLNQRRPLSSRSSSGPESVTTKTAFIEHAEMHGWTFSETKQDAGEWNERMERRLTKGSDSIIVSSQFKGDRTNWGKEWEGCLFDINRR